MLDSLEVRILVLALLLKSELWQIIDPRPHPIELQSILVVLLFRQLLWYCLRILNLLHSFEVWLRTINFLRISKLCLGDFQILFAQVFVQALLLCIGLMNDCFKVPWVHLVPKAPFIRHYRWLIEFPICRVWAVCTRVDRPHSIATSVLYLLDLGRLWRLIGGMPLNEREAVLVLKLLDLFLEHPDVQLGRIDPQLQEIVDLHGFLLVLLWITQCRHICFSHFASIVHVSLR